MWQLQNAPAINERALHLLDYWVALKDNPALPCPLSIRLMQRVIEVDYYSFDGEEHTGQLVVHESIHQSVTEIFRQLREMRFPIGSIVPISAFQWDDSLSMALNNTSGFNYRYIAGTSRLSAHAHGLAIDLNPFLNPCIKGEEVVPNGACYNPLRPGTLHRDSPVVELFLEYGFEWGGHWQTLQDYHHFQFAVLPPGD